MPTFIRELNGVSAISQSHCRRCWGKDHVLVEGAGKPLTRCARCGFLISREESKTGGAFTGAGGEAGAN
jgi:hypothetical protein